MATDMMGLDWLSHPIFSCSGPFEGFCDEYAALAMQPMQLTQAAGGPPGRSRSDVIAVTDALKQWVPHELALAVRDAIEGAIVPQAEPEGSAAVAKAVAAGNCVPREAAVGLVLDLSREQPDLTGAVMGAILEAACHAQCQ